MEMIETKLSSEDKYKGVIVNIRKDIVTGIDGKKHTREVVEHPGGVVIIAITDENKVILIKQWRYPVGCQLIELPAGKLEKGEAHFDSAKRELEEETGFVAKSWEYKGFIYTTPGFCDEKLHFYLAKDLVKTQTNFDSGEIIEPYIINIEDAIEMAQQGQIVDAKTIVGLNFLKAEQK